MNYLIYKITNRLNNKIYVGAHKTDNINDEYFGSGLLLERAVSKHGKENFTKEILFKLNSTEEMWQKEADIVDEEFIARDDTYNIKLGGCGGFDYINNNELKNKSTYFKKGHTLYKKGIENRKMRMDNDEEYRKAFIEKMTAANKLKCQLFGNGWSGRKHSDEAKKKIGEANSKKLKGKNNPSYGKHWVTDGTISKLIPKDEKLPDGFYKGRV